MGDILKEILPQDLLKYGLIPEFVGRVPVIVTLESLDEKALVTYLQPKNALVKQYKKLFDMDGVKLSSMKGITCHCKESHRERDRSSGIRAILERS